jgi:hypothetical protein
MILRLFAAFAMILLAVFAAQEAAAEQKAKPLKAGDVLSGQLTAMRSGPRKKRVITYQLTSEPRLLPPGSAISRPAPRRSRSSPTATPRRRR